MRPIRTPQTNVTLTLSDKDGKRIPDADLPATRFLGYDASAGETTSDARQMWESAWLPDEKEAARLEAGAPVILRINGADHPPVSLRAGDAVVPEREMIDRGHVDRALGLLYGQLKERAEKAILEMQAEDVHSRELVTAGGDVNAEAVGLPGPNALADLWLKAVEETRQRPDAPTVAALEEVDAAIDQILGTDESDR